MKETHERINELVAEIHKLLQEQIAENSIKYEKYILIDFGNKLEEILNELNFSLSEK